MKRRFEGNASQSLIGAKTGAMRKALRSVDIVLGARTIPTPKSAASAQYRAAIVSHRGIVPQFHSPPGDTAPWKGLRCLLLFWRNALNQSTQPAAGETPRFEQHRS